MAFLPKCESTDGTTNAGLPEKISFLRGVKASMSLFSRTLEVTLDQAVANANQRGHEHATLEHLLLALIDDADASAAIEACKVDIDALKVQLTNYIDNELTALVTDDSRDRDSRPTAAFDRVVRRAALQINDLGHSTVTGADILVAVLDETESYAVWLLAEQGMTRLAAANFTLHGVVRQPFSHGRTKPIVVKKVKRRTTARTNGKKAKDTK